MKTQAPQQISDLSFLQRSVRRLPLIVGLLGLAFGILAFISVTNQPKVGVIRTDELVYSYRGMAEAQEKYKDKHAGWEEEADSLREDLESAVQKYAEEQSSLSKAAQRQREKELALMEKSLYQRGQHLAQRASQEDRELTEGVLNQINVFIENYGEEHGYDIILGSNGSGNILHSVKGYDITEDVLKALNDSYRIAGR